MESRLLSESIEEYCNRFSKKVCDNFFRDNDVITGKKILELTGISQVNLFVIRILYRNWALEKDRLYSPYFDYSNDEVQKLLGRLMNQLSKHIQVEKNDFEPLLVEATSHSIRLIFSPYDFYTHNLMPEAISEVALNSLEEDLRYIKVNKGPLVKAVEELRAKDVEMVTRDDLQEALHDVLGETDESPEGLEDYLQQFSQVEPLGLSQIYAETNQEPRSEEEQPSGSNIHEKFTEEGHLTLNDQHSESGDTLASMHESKKIENVLSNISVNQRYMFVNELFSGNTEKFTEAFEMLEGFQDYDQAIEALHRTYAEDHNWDLEAEPYQELLAILDKRYH